MSVLDHLENRRPAGNGAPQVSVVVATRNRAGYLGGLTAALEAQDMARDQFELIVVDDASTDDTWETLKHLLHDSPLPSCALRLQERSGQGGARNVGWRAARGEIVAFTDDDCIPAPNWLTALTRPFHAVAGAGTPELVVQGKTVPWEDDLAQAGPWPRTVWVLRPTWLFETCNVAYRRSDLFLVGGFPGAEEAPATADGKAVGEDAILGWRVVEGGSGLVFVEHAQVRHRNERASYAQWLRAHLGRAVFPDLVRRSPYGRRALWCRLFLAPRSAALDLAVICGATWIVRRRARWLAGTLPWIWMALPEARTRGGRHPVVRLSQIAAGDLLGLGALLAAGIRRRCVVL